MIYFIYDSAHNAIKIGWTTGEIETRLAALQVGTVSRLRVILTTDGGSAEERNLHETFSHLRVAGEWFRAEPDLVAFINKSLPADGCFSSDLAKQAHEDAAVSEQLRQCVLRSKTADIATKIPSVATKRFTDSARRVMAIANYEGQRMNHTYVGTEHLLLALINEGRFAGVILNRFGITLGEARRILEPTVGDTLVEMGKLPQNVEFKNTLDYAEVERQKMGNDFIGTEHLLLGILKDSSTTAMKMILAFDVAPHEIRNQIMFDLGQPLPAPPAAPRGPVTPKGCE